MILLLFISRVGPLYFQKRASTEEHAKEGDRTEEESSIQSSASDSKPDERRASTEIDNKELTQGNLTAEVNIEMQDKIDDNFHVDAALSDALPNEVSKHDDKLGEAVTGDKVAASSLNSELGNDMVPSAASPDLGTEQSPDDHPINPDQSISMKDADDSVKPGDDKSQFIVDGTPPVNTDKKMAKTVNAIHEPTSNSLKQEDEKARTSLNKVEEQLDEVRFVRKVKYC